MILGSSPIYRENLTMKVAVVKEYCKSMPEFELVDNVKILQAILMRQLPSERFNGIINMLYAMRPNATSKEIETALVILFL